MYQSIAAGSLKQPFLAVGVRLGPADSGIES